VGPGLPVTPWARGRGWALWKALVTIGEGKGGGGDAQAAGRRTIGLVIADHADSARR
jgi:hypothetical protein